MVVVVVTHNYLLLPLELPTDNNLNVQTARPPDFLSRFYSAAHFQNSRPQLAMLSQREVTNVFITLQWFFTGMGNLLDEFVKLAQRKSGGRRRWKKESYRKLIGEKDGMTRPKRSNRKYRESVAADGKGAKYWCTSQLGTNLRHHKWRYRSTVGQANTHMLGCLHTREHNSDLTACPSLFQGQ